MGTSLHCTRTTSWAVAGTVFQHVFAATLHKPESAASQGNAAEEGEKGEKSTHECLEDFNRDIYCSYH